MIASLRSSLIGIIISEQRGATVTDVYQSLDRDLLRHIGGGPSATGVAPLSSQETSLASLHVDISGVLEAVRYTASSMSEMTERIQEYEAHIEALEHSREQLETQRHQLIEQLDEIERQRGSLAADLDGEVGRVRKLENLTAQHVSRAGGIERDLDLARADLAMIVEAVGTAFGGSFAAAAKAETDQHGGT